ncbi:MAG: tetratricopeptide (TPR) repeat protein [Gammaproteobacteria bacterium]|jgi:tetratricopeptide (TPR) repeat protein
MDAMGMLQAALELHQQGQVAQALEGYRQVLALEPDNHYALNFAGAAYAELGDMRASIKVLRRCTEVAPDYPDAHANLALALRGVGELDAALAAQQRVLALLPADASALNEMGITLRRMGRYQAAASTYRQAITQSPDLPDAYANLGNVLQDLDNMEEAVACYADAIAKGAHQPSVHRGLGNALQRLHRPAEAEAAYGAALALDPHDVDALTDLGGTLVELGRALEGCDTLRRAARLAPQDPTVHANLGMALDETGATAAALQAFDRALALDPGNTHALAYQTLTLHRVGEHARVRDLVGLDDLVRELRLPLPAGYDSHDTLNQELAAYACAHPSLWSGRRKGISSELFLDAEGPPLVLRGAIDEAVDTYIDALPSTSGHPFVARRPSQFLLSGWCNVLDAGADAHVHPNAWLSGVYYVRTEGVVDDSVTDQAGCLQVGPPDEKFYAARDFPARVFRPRDGWLVVFPSYVWHRILPFEGRGQRISYAFDVVPVA